jgi:hypothetical protein
MHQVPDRSREEEPQAWCFFEGLGATFRNAAPAPVVKALEEVGTNTTINILQRRSSATAEGVLQRPMLARADGKLVGGARQSAICTRPASFAKVIGVTPKTAEARPLHRRSR